MTLTDPSIHVSLGVWVRGDGLRASVVPVDRAEGRVLRFTLSRLKDFDVLTLGSAAACREALEGCGMPVGDAAEVVRRLERAATVLMEGVLDTERDCVQIGEVMR